MANLFCVKDKVVIITGGAGILCRGIPAHLAEEGAKIVIQDTAAEDREQIVADITEQKRYPGQIWSHRCIAECSRR